MGDKLGTLEIERESEGHVDRVRARSKERNKEKETWGEIMEI